jgi:hypothetical protein
MTKMNFLSLFTLLPSSQSGGRVLPVPGKEKEQLRNKGKGIAGREWLEK